MDRTFIDLFNQRVAETPDNTALLHSVGGSWEPISWLEYDQQTSHIAHGLMSLGLEPGDRVALLSHSRVEWVLADIGILKAGCCSVPIHANSMSDQVEHLLADSGAKAIFVESEKELACVRKVSAKTALEHVLVMRSPARGGSNEVAWEELLTAGRVHKAEFPGTIAARQKALEPSSLATIVYTSGTTGLPKGVMLTQGNIVFQVEALARVMRGVLGPDDLHLMCLPLSHILARSILMGGVTSGYANAFTTSLAAIEREMVEVRPTFITVVPLVLEQFHTAIKREFSERNPVSRRVIRWARGVGSKVAGRRSDKRPLGLSLAVKDALNSKLVLGRGIAERFGGRLKFFICGGAPLSATIAEFLESLGVLVLEGYGLTENVGAANVNQPNRYRLGTVGPPVLGVEERIAEDGEILVRGPNVMAGYYKQAEATAEVIDEEGWLHTGDLGQFEEGGFLRVTGRKKDLIVTSGGKNVAPQNIEKLLRTSRFIQQAMVYGDGRRYLTALVSLDEECLQRFAEDEDLAFDKFTELAVHPRVRAQIQREIDDRNRKLASYETIKRFAILPEPLSLDAGDLTPTRKIRRQEVEIRYRDLLEEMYEDPSQPSEPAWAGES
jgi:long-chain acyl-CoA synthetase